MGLLDKLFGRDTKPAAQDDHQLAEMVERVLTLSPRLRLASRFQPRLEEAVGAGLAYICRLVDSLPLPHEASAAAWADDASIRAFFVSPDEVPQLLSRSPELCALFEREPGLQQAFGVLGMALEQRGTLGVAQEGDVTRRDVQQTTLSFSDHQFRICAASEAELKDELVRRLVDQLALEALARVATDDSRRDVLEQERKLLLARLRLLERQGAGMRSVVGGEGAGADEGASLQKQREENDRELAALGSRSESLERQLAAVCEVFAEPLPLLNVSRRQQRLSRMNVLLAEGAAEGDLIDYELARVPGDPPRERAFALLRFSREHLQVPGSRLTDADRLLI